MKKRDMAQRIRALEAEVEALRGALNIPQPFVPLIFPEIRTGSATWSPRCTCYDGVVTGPCLVHLTVWSTNT